MNHETRTTQQHGAHPTPEEAGHAEHGEHAGHGGADSSWGAAVSATLHCLTGCAIGEVLGMVLGTWWGWGTWETVVLAVVLAFFFGYLLTVTSVLRSGLSLGRAVRIALVADTISITVMEIVDNAVMVLVPGAMHAGLANWVFWAALAFAFAVAFVVTLPVNRWLIARGKGHAVVHEYHH
ncbi:MAG: DUF4396 domain-containing protein [Brachybacterium paraconglomeratum]|nr:DUF4396 domain-containing protein [Brachybacterium paraconglomeratum]